MERCYVTDLSLAVHFAYVFLYRETLAVCTLNCRDSLDQREVDIPVRTLMNWQNAPAHKFAGCVV
jgi:hypothetical protein